MSGKVCHKLSRPVVICFLSSQPNKDISVEKTFKFDEEDRPKPKLIDARKVTMTLTCLIALVSV